MALRLERASESARGWWKHKLLVPPPELGIRGLAGDPRTCISPRLPGEAGTGGLGPPLRRAESQGGRGAEAQLLQFVDEFRILLFLTVVHYILLFAKRSRD